MYFVMVIGLMVVLPIASAVIELIVTGASNPVEAVGRWFLFWGAGVRLFIAGISQTFRPEFTARNILGESSATSNQLVQELGFANLGIGVAAIVAPWVTGWMVPVAIIPGIFLLLAGLRHVGKRDKNPKEAAATWTDILVGGVLVIFVVLSIAGVS